MQRVDRFDDDIANIVTNSAKRSGLTFAPEAGTQVGGVRGSPSMLVNSARLCAARPAANVVWLCVVTSTKG